MNEIDQKATEYLSRATAAKKRQESAANRAAQQSVAPSQVDDKFLAAQQLAQDVLDGKREEPTPSELINTLL